MWPHSCPLQVMTLYGFLYPRLQTHSSLTCSIWSYLPSTNVLLFQNLKPLLMLLSLLGVPSWQLPSPLPCFKHHWLVKESSSRQCFKLEPLWWEGYNASKSFQWYLVQTLKRWLHLKTKPITNKILSMYVPNTGATVLSFWYTYFNLVWDLHDNRLSKNL